MNKLLIALTAAAGALLWSVPALAFRVEFHTVHGGERVAASEVCFFEASSARNPFGHFLSSTGVHCLPADQVLDIPAGQWNYFGRSGAALTSAGPALLRIPKGREELGYQAVPIELHPAGTLDVTAVRKTLGAGESLAIFLPEPFGATSNARPVTHGEETVVVPAGTPLIPLVVRDGRPVRAGDLVTLAAGERKAATFTPPAPGTGDAVVWLQLDAELARGLEHGVSLPLPAIALRSARGEHLPVIAPQSVQTMSLAFQVFRGIPAGPARVVASGDSWEASDIALDVPDGGLVVVDEPLALAPAGTVVVRWRIDGDPSRAAVPPRQTCDGAGETPPANPAKRSLRILRCAASAPEGDCSVAFERDLPAGAIDGSARVASLTAGVYVAELRIPPFAPVREEVYASAGRRNDVELVAAPATVYGTVTRSGKPVRASLTFGTESFVTDDSGAFTAAIARSTGTSPIRVTPCDTREPFLHHPEAPLEPNAFVAIDVPAHALEVRVVGRGGAAIDEATVTLMIPEPGGTDAAKASHTLAYDAGRSAYVRPQFRPVESRVCAKALGYTMNCVDLRADFEPSEPVTVTLEETSGIRGRVVTVQAVVRGTLFVVGAGGGILARTEIAGKGAFEIPSTPPPGSAYLLVAASHPLTTLTLQPASGELLLSPLPGRPRHFALIVAEGSTIDRGRVALSVGATRVPAEAFEMHQQLHGHRPMVDGEHPLFVGEVAETGAIGAQLLPLTPVEPGAPLPAGLLPEESDLLVLR
ncbi:MAG TPA: hypothetical protein VEK57_15815 [Thermoanaerobaculia bacterium]|nr:hypothetical protein [Thermoanaerobaculia bacterium]